jgi:hypothetical protein
MCRFWHVLLHRYLHQRGLGRDRGYTLGVILVVGGFLALIAWAIIVRVTTGWQRKQEERLAKQMLQVRGAPAVLWRRLTAKKPPPLPPVR